MRKGTLAWIVAVLCFLLALQRLEAGRKAEGVRQLEEALRNAAVSCYACEGFYPTDLAYLKEHYALEYDEKAYTVHYEAIASNLMPEITVLENLP